MENKDKKIKELSNFLKEGLLDSELKKLLEDLGDAAAEPVATSNEQPEELQPSINNDDTFSTDEHDQTEEIEEIIVEDIQLSESEIYNIEESLEFLQEEVLQEGVKVAGVKVISKMLGVMPNALVDRSFARAYSKLSAEEKQEYRKIKFDRRTKITILRGLLKASYNQPNLRNKIDKTADKVMAEKNQKNVNEAVATLGAGLVLTVGGLMAIILGTLAASAISTVFGMVTARILAESVETAEIVNDKGELEMTNTELKNKEELEPEVKAPDPEVDADFDGESDALESLEESFASIFSILEGVEGETDLGDAAAQPVALSKETPDEEQPAENNETLFPADEHEQAEEVKEVIVEGIEGETDLGDAAAQPVALSADVASEEQPAMDNDDSHPADEHDQAEEIEEVIVEGVEGETDLGDAAAQPVALSKETPDEEQPAENNETLFPADEHNQAEEIEEVIVEDQRYSSLKEAFLLDQNYFDNHGYVKVTADEKKAKLQEQMALLIARESVDPLYEELLEATIVAKKLQKEIKNKYQAQAKEKADKVIEMKKGKKA